MTARGEMSLLSVIIIIHCIYIALFEALFTIPLFILELL